MAIYPAGGGSGGAGNDTKAIKSIEIPFSDSTASSTDTIPQNAVIRKVAISILVAYDDAKTFVIDNGDGSQTFATFTGIAEAINYYVMEMRTVWTETAATPRIVLSGDGADGNGVMVIDYVEEPGS